MERAFEIYGKCMENIWNVYGTSVWKDVAHIWNICDICGKRAEHMWSMYGKSVWKVCMENIWNIQGQRVWKVCVGNAWDIYEETETVGFVFFLNSVYLFIYIHGYCMDPYIYIYVYAYTWIYIYTHMDPHL